jgi:membrane protease YdiL (CAAX protease family)
MRNTRHDRYRAAVGPALCLLLYASDHAHGVAPLLTSLLFAVLLFNAGIATGRRASLAFALAGAVFLAMGFGLVPGFTPIALGTAQVNSGKALAGLAALAMFPSHWQWNRRCSAIAAVCLLTVPLLAWAIGYVHWAPAASAAVGWFALANGVGTIAEEWFFRLWVQRPLQRFGVAPSLLLTALLFGLVHFGGGPVFMALAALAGLAYAGVYQAGGNSVWAAVALHLALNVTRAACFGL